MRPFRACSMTTPALLLLLLLSAITFTYTNAAAAAQPLRLYGINYSSRQGPDWDPNKCKSYTQVLADLTALHGLTRRVRILSLSDCGQGELVVQAANALGMKVYLGLWVSGDPTVFDAEVAVLQSLMDSSMIDATNLVGVTVGSEAVYRGDATADAMVDYWSQVKTLMTNTPGFESVPVSICDVDDMYLQYPQLNSGDQVVINSFPYWEGQDINNAAAYLETQIGQVLSRANGKAFTLGETGWPSNGTSDQTSIASPANQAQYLNDFYCRMDQELNWEYYFFTGIDSDWRLAQDNKADWVEGHFGILHSDLTLKEYFVDYVFTCPGSTVEYTIQPGSSSSSGTTPTTPSPAAVATLSPSFAPAIASSMTVKPTRRPSRATAAPTRHRTTPTASIPTNSTGGNSEISSCSAYTACSALRGDCCPASDGSYLSCCSGGLIPVDLSNFTAGVPTLSPSADLVTAAPSATKGRRRTPVPTIKPTRAIVSVGSRSRSPSMTTTATESPTVVPTATESPTKDTSRSGYITEQPTTFGLSPSETNFPTSPIGEGSSAIQDNSSASGLGSIAAIVVCLFSILALS